MLTPEELELLTAHVDGELSSRQRRAAAQLLRRSPAARALLRSLMSDSRELVMAPAVPAPADFSAGVLDAIAARKVQPARAPRPAAARRVSPYFAAAAAAAVLLAVGATSFFLHVPGPRPQPERGGLAHKAPEPALKPPEKDAVVVKQDAEPLPPPWVEMLPTVKIVPAEEPDEPETPAPLPAPREGDRPMTPVLASGQREVPNQLERVEFALPRVHIFHGLGVPEQGRALREQFALGSAYRVEIPARDAGRGLERLRLALTGQKAALTYTPEAQARLKKPVRGDSYAVFVENVAAEDLADALRQAGTADRVAALKRSADLCFDGPLVVRELGRFDRRELKELLGVDPLEARPSPRPAAVDIRRPIEESTGAAVSDALAGRGVPRPGVARGPSVGVVLALPAGRGKSAELKRFLETRPAARPGTLQVLIVLRNVG